jgi:hypothetical protein
VVLAEGILFVKPTKVDDDWLWRNGRIDSMPKVGFDCFDKLVLERVNDMMENIAGGEGPIALCG